MRILLLGKNGQVGWELQRTLMPLGEIISTDYPEIDLADFNGIRNLIRELRPQMIVNAAAYTDVDKAESEPELAFAINGTAPGVLAEEAKRIGAALIHYSSDYVFDGQKGVPYVETDTPNPINVYGQSKLAGERAIQQVGSSYLILRTAWVYSLRRDNFVTKVLMWARQKEILTIVEDQIGSPTWARVLAEITALVIGLGMENIKGYLSERCGIYHLVCTGSPSRLEWARIVLEYDPCREEQRVRQIMAANSSDFSSPAPRPPNSSLNSSHFSQTFGICIPDWQSTLRLALGKDHKALCGVVETPQS
ncbi:MAG: dTDP-4-dehydrorhamnose reductase [Anaerolinea sp.]|nr:dTDP-4-dehydrorhamnose reductase [Anaerolinea sp.]